MMIRIAIVEDDELMAQELMKHSSHFFEKNQIEVKFFLIKNGFDIIENYSFQYDLIFMDVNLPIMNGFEISKKIRDKDTNVMIIFITSFSQYALEGYKVNAFDYLIKPIEYNNLNLTLKRALPFLKKSGTSITIRINRGGYVKIRFEDLLYIEVNHHYLSFHLKDEVFESKGQLKTYTDLLKNESFSLCHQSYFVNLNYVKSINNNYVIVGKDVLPISRSRKKAFLNDLNLYFSIGNGK